MIVAYNTLPLITGHKVRGVGSYTKNLLENLHKITSLEIKEFKNLSEIEKADVVHFPWFDLFFHTLPLWKKFPTVVTIHDVTPLIFSKNYPKGIRGKINNTLQIFSLKNCSNIITVSENSKKDIIKYLGVKASKIKVIYEAPGKSFKRLSDAEVLKIKRTYNLPDQYILYVGDADWIKNLPFLIKGFHKIIQNEKYKNLKLVLVGGVFLKKVDDINHPELESLKLTNKLIEELRLENSVIRPGFLSIEDLVGFFNLATLYVQPSIYEGFGLPVLEAMACGTPVLSSNAASLPEVGGDAAIYFNPENIDQFTRIALDLLGDASLRSKLSQIGLQRAATYSWEKVSGETVTLYEEAIKNR